MDRARGLHCPRSATEVGEDPHPGVAELIDRLGAGVEAEQRDVGIAGREPDQRVIDRAAAAPLAGEQPDRLPVGRRPQCDRLLRDELVEVGQDRGGIGSVLRRPSRSGPSRPRRWCARSDCPARTPPPGRGGRSRGSDSSRRPGNRTEVSGALTAAFAQALRGPPRGRAGEAQGRRWRTSWGPRRSWVGRCAGVSSIRSPASSTSTSSPPLRRRAERSSLGDHDSPRTVNGSSHATKIPIEPGFVGRGVGVSLSPSRAPARRPGAPLGSPRVGAVPTPPGSAQINHSRATCCSSTCPSPTPPASTSCGRSTMPTGSIRASTLGCRSSS